MWDTPNTLLIVFGFVILIILINQIFASIRRAQTLKALKRAAKDGTPISDEALKAFGSDEDSSGDNLQGGVILIAIALGIAVSGYLLSIGILADHEDSRDLMYVFVAGAVIPGFIGVALILLHILRGGKK